MRRAVVDVQNSVREGESIAKPLAQARGVPADGRADARRRRGDRAGRHDAGQGREFYDQEVEATVDALTSLIEPLLIAIIGGCVGAAVIALYMPMFNIIKLIQ